MKLTINKETYNLKTEWSDMTLEDASKLLRVEVPEVLKTCYDELKKKKGDFEGEYAKIETKDLIKTLPAFYSELLGVLSDIPKELINKTGYEDRTAYYFDFIEPLYVPLYLQSPVHEPKYPEKFTHRDVEYHFPKSLKVFSQHIPMYEEEAISFVEESDIMIAVSNMGQNGFGSMAEVAAVMCREEGEDYDEAKRIRS
jgi:hypothetical protein